VSFTHLDGTCTSSEHWLLALGIDKYCLLFDVDNVCKIFATLGHNVSVHNIPVLFNKRPKKLIPKTYNSGFLGGFGVPGLMWHIFGYIIWYI